MKTTLQKLHFLLLCSAALLVATLVRADSPVEQKLRDAFDGGVRYSQIIDFPQRIGAAGDPVVGQAKFGIAADGINGDDSQAIFDGLSIIAGNVVANGRTCFTCHRPNDRLGLPKTPMSATLPPDDVVFTGQQADGGDEPLGPQVLDQLGLVLYRPGRFNPLLAPDDPFKKVFFWRKSIRLLNTVFTFGLLNDGRMRELAETARGALFSHTQNGDVRFDDLTNQPCFPNGICGQQDLKDLGAFIEAQIEPPELAALLDPQDPLHDTLIADPFYTVTVTTAAEERGKELFEKSCFYTCHNMPNVFSNRDHIDGLPLAYPPHYGHPMDIGVAQQNFRDLEFRRFDVSTGQRETIVLPLVRQDGVMVNVAVVDDIGVAATTGRYEDLHRFKVPQLRRISELGPYFHDDSMPTLKDVIDYFDSPAYNQSADGKKYPIHFSEQQKQDLLAFLLLL